MRVLDLDLDFFVHGVEHMRNSDDPRLDPADTPPWTIEETLDFLEHRCGLRERLPGAVVEHHGDMFDKWRDALVGGHLRAPFSVTHVDAHADLGLGDAGWVAIVTGLLDAEVETRAMLIDRTSGLDDGNFLAYAIACRWLSRLDYVHNDEGGGDLMTVHMADFDSQSGAVQLKTFDPDEYLRWIGFPDGPKPAARHLEPRVPLNVSRWDRYSSDEPFDAVCLCRSPGFTPADSDTLFDLIRERFIDESAWLE